MTLNDISAVPPEAQSTLQSLRGAKALAEARFAGEPVDVRTKSSNLNSFREFRGELSSCVRRSPVPVQPVEPGSSGPAPPGRMTLPRKAGHGTGTATTTSGTSCSIENGKRDRARRLFVQAARVVEQVLRLLAGRRNHARRDVDRELRLVLDEAAALEELAQDGDVAEQGHLRDFLVVGVAEQSGEDDGFAVLDGDAGLH